MFRIFVINVLRYIEGDNGLLFRVLGSIYREWMSFRLGITLYFFNHIVACIPIHLLRLLFYRRLFHIGQKTSILMNVEIWSTRGLTIGHNSTINPGSILDSRGGLIIGNNVNIAAHVHIWTAEHEVDSPLHQTIRNNVLIEDYAWIASRVTILPGVTIGYGSVVGAGSVVSKDIPPYTVVAGNPARIIKERPQSLEYQINHFPYFR